MESNFRNRITSSFRSGGSVLEEVFLILNCFVSCSTGIFISVFMVRSCVVGFISCPASMCDNEMSEIKKEVFNKIIGLFVCITPYQSLHRLNPKKVVNLQPV